MLRRLTDMLSQGHSKVAYGPYMGFVWLKFSRMGGSRRSSHIFYDHGHWGGIVSKGTQAATRYQAIAPQADVVYSGHTHDRNMMEMPTYWVRSNGNAILKNQIYLKGGTYKEEFLGGSGWAVEKIAVPKNIGGWWASCKIDKAHGLVEWNVSLAK